MGVTLDSGALIAIDRGNDRARRHLRNARSRGLAITVPTAAITEAWRDGRRQVALRKLLGHADIEPLDEDLARRSGELLGRTGSADIVDAIVASSAARRGDQVLTSDPGDLQRLADELGTIRVVAI